MKAALCYEAGKPLVIEDITMAITGPLEVKVKVGATAVCQSDIHVIRRPPAHQIPGLAGHETAGIVEEVGEGVTRVKPGDHVCATTTTVGCGFCANCLSGNRTLCTTYPLMGVKREPRIFTKHGTPIATMAGTVGGFAEYVLVREHQVVKIDENVPIDRAALLSCCFSTGFGSAITAGVNPFSSALIFGTGAVGISAIQGSLFLGACPVIALDIVDNRLEEAQKFGATHTINSTKVKDPIKAIQDLTDGKGADYVFITATAANNDLMRQAIEMSSLNGTIIGIAIMVPTGPADDIEWARPMFARGSQRRIIRTLIGSADIIKYIPSYIKLYKAGRIKLDEYITGHYPLEKINEAIEGLASTKALRNVIMFQ